MIIHVRMFHPYIQNIIQSNYIHITSLSSLQGVMRTSEESKIVVTNYWTNILYIIAWSDVFLTLNITTCLGYPFRKKDVQ